MAPPKNKGPSLSAGFLRHIGVDANPPPGSSGKRSGVQSRKDDRKQARSKSHGPSNKRLGNQKQTPKNFERPTFDSVPVGRNSIRKISGGHTITPQKGEAGRFSRRPPKEYSLGTQGMKNRFSGSDMPEEGSYSLDNDDEDEADDGEDDEDDDEDEADDDEDEADDDEDDDDDSDGHGNGLDHTTTGGGMATRVPTRVREKLAQDDVEIAELERKLGIKGRKSLPKAFKDDGLGDLLDDLQDNAAEDLDSADKKKRKAEADEWLRLKRRKAEETSGTGAHLNKSGSDGEDGLGYDKSGDGPGSFDGSGEGDDAGDDGTGSKKQPSRQRENPYKAPVTATLSPQKYIPPALRKSEKILDAESEAVARVQKQAHHLIARLSDANMLSILGEVDKLYMNYPRQHVTGAIVDKLLEQVEIEGALSNNVTILIAGFATAVYTAKGTDFGAHFIQQNATHFREHYNTLTKAGAADATDALRDQHHSWAPASKIALNLFTLMAELYNFRMIGSNLIYDYIRMLLDHITEFNAELLVRVFEVSGHRLRQDDSGELKGVVSLIQPAVVRAGGYKSLSVRTRHMIGQISNLKRSDRKKHRDAESSGFGHAERMRKMLGTLPASRKVEAAGPLHVSLVDLEQADRRGKWWLVGASWAGRGRSPSETSTGDGDGQNNKAAGGSKSERSVPSPTQNVRTHEDRNKDRGREDGDDVLGSWAIDIPDMEELNLLAREQGMNTDARRSIFVALLSAADSRDAHARLLRLGLNKHQKREVANVLIRCVGSEQHYNRYYALVARHVCSADRRMDWVFQASLWKLFRRLGEPIFGEAQEDDLGDEEDEATDLRRVVNTAKMYGHLVACGSVSLGILKCLSLAGLQLKTRMFVEVLLLALFDEVRQADKEGGSVLIRKIFASAVRNNEELRRGLQYFVDKVVRKSKLVGRSQAPDIARLCDVAQRALAEETLG